jgi:hypothetical protein
LRSCIAFSTFSDAFAPYLATVSLLRLGIQRQARIVRGRALLLILRLI